MSMDSDPPFHKAYKSFFDKTIINKAVPSPTSSGSTSNYPLLVEECDLPLIDLSLLDLGDEAEIDNCKSQIARASQEWGFFQVVNHGISSELLEKMRSEQKKVFSQPFDMKSQENKYLNFSAGSYRWGTPTATCLRQVAWSEAFHIPLSNISGSDGLNTLRYIRLYRVILLPVIGHL